MWLVPHPSRHMCCISLKPITAAHCPAPRVTCTGRESGGCVQPCWQQVPQHQMRCHRVALGLLAGQMEPQKQQRLRRQQAGQLAQTQRQRQEQQQRQEQVV